MYFATLSGGRTYSSVSLSYALPAAVQNGKQAFDATALGGTLDAATQQPRDVAVSMHPLSAAQWTEAADYGASHTFPRGEPVSRALYQWALHRPREGGVGPLINLRGARGARRLMEATPSDDEWRNSEYSIRNDIEALPDWQFAQSVIAADHRTVSAEQYCWVWSAARSIPIRWRREVCPFMR